MQIGGERCRVGLVVVRMSLLAEARRVKSKKENLDQMRKPLSKFLMLRTIVILLPIFFMIRAFAAVQRRRYIQLVPSTLYKPASIAAEAGNFL